MNPSLVNCCTIDWFNEWDREAMLSVARMYFQNADFMCDDSEKYQVLSLVIVDILLLYAN